MSPRYEGKSIHAKLKGDRLRFWRVAGKSGHSLQGKPVELGELLELRQPGGWTSGRYAWTGRRTEAPFLLLCFYRGELHTGVKLNATSVLRRPRSAQASIKQIQSHPHGH